MGCVTAHFMAIAVVDGISPEGSRAILGRSSDRQTIGQ
jgi:hypothetical protein